MGEVESSVAIEENPPLEDGIREISDLLGGLFVKGMAEKAVNFTKQQFTTSDTGRRTVYTISTEKPKLAQRTTLTVIDVMDEGSGPQIKHVYLQGHAGILDFTPNSSNPNKGVGGGTKAPHDAILALNNELASLGKPKTTTYKIPSRV